MLAFARTAIVGSGPNANVGGRGFPYIYTHTTRQAMLRTAAGCLTIQLNSDTIYLKVAFSSYRLRAQSHKTTLHFRCPLSTHVVNLCF